MAYPTIFSGVLANKRAVAEGIINKEVIMSAPTALMKSLGYGEEYRYAHNEPNAYAAGENYFPPELSETVFYIPSERGMEKQIKEKMAWLKAQDEQSQQKRYKS